MSVFKHAPIDYSSDFDKSKLEKVKLIQRYDDDTTRKKEVPIFDGYGGIEALLYVEEQFRKAAGTLDFDTGRELFEHKRLADPTLCLGGVVEGRRRTECLGRSK